MCIRSLSEMAIKLQELYVLGRDHAISHGVFSRASPEDYNHLVSVFVNLRKIGVHVNTHQDTYPLTFGGLGQLLTRATELSSLDLRSHSGYVRKSRLILSRLFHGFTWSHLRHIGLSGFKMHTDAELISFFDLHRATINSVTLRFIFLHEIESKPDDHSPCEAWKHFFGELRKRSIKFQHLTLFRIHDCCNSEHDKIDLHVHVGGGKKVLKYLDHGGPNPLVRCD